MRFFVILGVLVLNGCAIVKPAPIEYDMGHRPSNPQVPLSNSNLPALAVRQFTYEPQKTISQYQVAGLSGCLMCNQDGTYASFLYAQPVPDIIQYEAEQALLEIAGNARPSHCSISAQIHTVGYDGNFGNTTLDLTYVLRIGNSNEYIKRIQGKFNEDIFPGPPVKKLWENATRDSIRQLMRDKSFSALVNERCVGRG